MTPTRTRPTIPPWPGYACGKSQEQWDAPHRGRQGVFDRELRLMTRKAKAHLKTAIADGDAERVEATTTLLQGLRDGLLPVAKSKTKTRTTATGAPICRPGGLTTPMGMHNRQPNENWRR